MSIQSYRNLSQNKYQICHGPSFDKRARNL